MNKPHMVEQIIKFSDGSETVIKYRGVIENGVLIPDSPEHTEASVAAEEPAEVPEAAEDASVDAPEAPAESVEESA